MLEKLGKIKIPLWVMIAAGMLIFGGYVCYMIHMFRMMPLDSDYSNLILEAKDLIEGNIFLKDWNQTGISFLTTDLLYYVAAVLVKGVSREAYWIASGLMVSCSFVMAFFLLNVGIKERKRFVEWVFFFSVSAFPSIFGVNVLRAHTGVYVYVFAALVFFYRLYETKGKSVLCSILFAVSVIMGCVGDAIIYIMLILPVLLVCFRDLLDGCSEKKREDLFIIVLTAGAVVLAGIFEKIYYFLGGANKNTFLESKVFEDLSAIPDKFNTYLHVVLGLNHADFTNQPVMSAETIFLFVNVLIVICSYIIIAWNIYGFVKGTRGDVISRILSLGFVVISFVLVFTNVSVDILSARYVGVCPMIFGILIVRFIWQHKLFQRRVSSSPIPQRAVLFFVAAMLLVNSYIPVRDQICAQQEQERVKDMLVENGLECGYANFWDASLITVLSDNEVALRAITIDEQMNALNWGCKTTWYEEEAHFVLVRNEEWVEYGVTYENVVDKLGEPAREIPYENYRVLIYDQDISQNIKSTFAE